MRSASALIAIALATPAFGQQIDRSARPPTPPAAAFNFPATPHPHAGEWRPLLVVEDHSVPVVAVRAIVGADSTWDPAGKEGYTR